MLPEGQQDAETSPRSRMPLEEFVFEDAWETPASVADSA
jgi:hypothetical protein